MPQIQVQQVQRVQQVHRDSQEHRVQQVLLELPPIQVLRVLRVQQVHREHKVLMDQPPIQVQQVQQVQQDHRAYKVLRVFLDSLSGQVLREPLQSTLRLDHMMEHPLHKQCPIYTISILIRIMDFACQNVMQILRLFHSILHPTFLTEVRLKQ